MITYFSKGQISKGSDCDIQIFLFPCFVDSATVENLTCSFFTGSGVTIEKEQGDFVFSGNSGAVHLQAIDLEPLEDGVLNYIARYTYGEQASAITIERNSNYFISTPVDYTPIDCVTTDEVEGVVASAMTSSAVTEEIQAIVDEATEPLVVRVPNPWGTLSGSIFQDEYAKAWDYLENHKSQAIVLEPRTKDWQSKIDFYQKVGGDYLLRYVIPFGSSTIIMEATFFERGGIYTFSTREESSITIDSWLWFDKYATSAATVSALTNLGYEISLKQDELVSGSNIKTIHGESILGAGNIDIVGPQGPAGPQGEQGPQGEKGEKGDTGEVDYSRLSAYTTTAITAELSAATSGIAVDLQALSAETETHKNSVEVFRLGYHRPSAEDHELFAKIYSAYTAGKTVMLYGPASTISNDDKVCLTLTHTAKTSSDLSLTFIGASNQRGTNNGVVYTYEVVMTRNDSTGFVTWSGMQAGNDAFAPTATISNYSLPIATSGGLGGVKVGSGLTINSNGVLSVEFSSNDVVYDYEEVIGMESAERIETWNTIAQAKADGKQVWFRRILGTQVFWYLMAQGVETSGTHRFYAFTPSVVYTLEFFYTGSNAEIVITTSPVVPTATSSVLGGVKVGSGLTIDSSGVLSADGGISSGDVQTMISSALTDYSTTAQTASAIATATQNMVSSTSINQIWTGSQSDYDAITTKDPNTLYIVQ